VAVADLRAEMAFAHPSPAPGVPGTAHQLTNLVAIVFPFVGVALAAGLEPAGLAWQVVRVTPHRQRAKAA
jgi:hypothetical protein